METPKIKVYAVHKIHGTLVYTSEGPKKIREDAGRKYILVSPELAKQLHDEVNWRCEEDLSKYKTKKVVPVHEQFEEDADEAVSTSDADEDSDMGDDETKVLLEEIPKVKDLKKLKEYADDLGLDYDDEMTKKDLKVMIIKKLKGKI